jgi:cbb3-type cytochrome oxidase subunit 3
MAGISYLLSTVVMGLFLIGVVAYARSGNRRQQPSTESRRPELTESSDDETDVLARYFTAATGVARNPNTWYIAFFLLVFGFAGGAIFLVTSSPEIGGLVFLGLALAFAVVLCAFLVWGIYRSGRTRGLKSAQAAMAGAWALGSLLVIAIVVKLVVSAP